jgi:DNA polymerase, archaea type
MSKRKRSDDGQPDRPTPVDPVLFGHSELKNVLAVQLLSESSVRLHFRATSPSGKPDSPSAIQHSDADFFPFFFLSHPGLIEGFPKRFWIKELAGANYYRYLVAFSRWNDLWEAVRFCLTNYNKSALRRASHYSEMEPLFLKPDPVSQYLLQSGVTLFKGMRFEELHRLQLSLQVYSKPGKKSDARKSEDRILVLALSDNWGWEKVLDGRKLKEEEILQQFVALVTERDPDLIEGHDLPDHAFPYLARRAELASVELTIGRNNAEVKSFAPRGNPLEPEFENAIFEVPGRHLVDTKSLAHGYNISKRALDHYGLRYLSQYFGFITSSADVIPQERIAPAWSNQPELLVQQGEQDCRDIRSISDRLARSYFFQTRMVPLSLDSLLRAGSSAKIELMMLREYIRQKYSIPKPQIGSQRTGGYTDIFVTGIVENALHADIESLYPSIMVTQQIKPATDELDVFPQLVKALTATRLDAKHALQALSVESDRQATDAFQSSLKILINSFYGYLGYPRGLFNDYEQADRVTASGQEMLRSIVRELDLRNAHVVEADTDGLFFIPPDNVRSEEQELAFVEKLSQALPTGINLILAGRYKKMLSYRKKNYALLDYRDRLTIKGSSLISRSLERFARNYIQLCITCLLQEDVKGLHQLYVSLSQDIAQHHWDVADFCRTETMRDSLQTYEGELAEGKRKPSPAYEVSKRSGIRSKPGDRVSYYVTGQHAGVKILESCKLASEWEPNFPDENTAYYIDRLNECSKKFDSFFEPAEFEQVFAGEDLFGFDPQNIHIQKQRNIPREEATPPEDEAGEFGIWLDEAGPG